MASCNPLGRHPPAFKNSVLPYRFIGILRTGGMKAANTISKKDFQKTLVRRQGFLIGADNELRNSAGELHEFSL
jgi:hypothetical protein